MVTTQLYKYECRLCKKITDQVERVITDNLPANVKTLQCLKCGVMGICLVNDATIEGVLK